MRDQKLWTWHLICGAVIAVFLGMHMVTMHLGTIVGLFNLPGIKPTEWASVVARGKTVLHAVVYIVLLAAALFHGLYGLRNIVFELSPSNKLRKIFSGLLVVGGVGLFGLGAWAAIASFQLARAI